MRAWFQWVSAFSILGAFGLATSAGAQSPDSVEIRPSSLTIEVGESSRVEAVVKDADGNVLADQQVLFFSGNRVKLGVTPSGLVEAYAPGEHKVTALVPETPIEGEPDSYTGFLDPGIRGSITVTVPVPPMVSVELVDPPEVIYAGTTVPVRVRGTDKSKAIRDDIVANLKVSDGAVVTTDGFGHITGVRPGTASLIAVSDDVRTEATVTVKKNPVSALELTASATEARTGDVIHFHAVARDAQGHVVTDVPIEYALRTRPDAADADSVGAGASAQVTADGRFVAEQPGIYTVLALSGGPVARSSVRIVPRRVSRKFEFVGHAPVRDRLTSDLWVWEGVDGRDYAAHGTWNSEGHAYFYDVTDPENMELVDKVQVDARTVNDVKVSEDGKICVISREGASNRRNGIVILDVSNPRDVQVLSAFDDQLTGGVHNVFVHDRHVYAVNNGRRWDIINIEDPTKPIRVGRFETASPGRSVHDVWVRDGIAYQAGRTDGLIVVDVGGGGMGGTPANPVEMGRLPQLTGWSHAVWPFESQSAGKFYVFGGDETFYPDPRAPEGGGLNWKEKLPSRAGGWIHVVEFDDMKNPTEVARYKVGDYGVHNYWIDWDEEILYVAYYQGGLRVVDISGELLGDLYRQGREIGRFYSDDPEGFVPNAPMAWGPQPHKGTIFFSDFHSGLWAVRLLSRDTGENERTSP